MVFRFVTTELPLIVFLSEVLVAERLSSVSSTEANSRLPQI